MGTRMKLISANGVEVNSLLNLGIDGLNAHCNQWLNQSNGDSLLCIPPIPQFKNPDLSDAVLAKHMENNLNVNNQTMKKKRKKKLQDTPDPTSNRLTSSIADRKADNAELMIITAVRELMKELNLGPMIAIRNLQLNMRPQLGKPSIKDIAPNGFDWDDFEVKIKECFACMGIKTNGADCEFDILLIGPKIGMIFIEVKSMTGLSRNRTASYKEACAQVNRADPFLDFLAYCCPNIARPDEQGVRKVIFTPHLSKLDHSQLTGLVDTNDITKWFQDDLNGQRKGPYTKLEELFKQTAAGISDECYKAYSAILAAITSMVISDHDQNLVRLDDMKLSETSFLSKQHECLRVQNPFGISKEPSKGVFPTLIKIETLPDAEMSKELKLAFQILGISFLTPSQLKAINCQDYVQFLFGVAGTGKTMILQAKALELLIKGHNVHILARQMNWETNWKQVFRKAKQHIKGEYRKFSEENIEFCRFPSLDQMHHAKYDHYIDHVRGNDLREGKCQVLRCDKLEVPSFATSVASLMKNAVTEPWHMFMDDTFCGNENKNHRPTKHALFAMTLMKYYSQYPNTTVWLATDPNQVATSDIFGLDDKYYWSRWEDAQWWLSCALEKTEPKTTTILKEAMRYSEEVYENVFEKNRVHMQCWHGTRFCGISPSDIEPVLGLKLVGKPTIRYDKPCKNVDDALAYFGFECSKLIQALGDVKRFAVILTAGNLDMGAEQGGNSHKVCLEQWFPDYDVRCARKSLKHSTNITDNRKVIFYASSSQTISLEWAFVVHLCLINGKNRRDNGESPSLNSAMYVAATRPTTSLLAEFCLEIEQYEPSLRELRVQDLKRLRYPKHFMQSSVPARVILSQQTGCTYATINITKAILNEAYRILDETGSDRLLFHSSPIDMVLKDNEIHFNPVAVRIEKAIEELRENDAIMFEIRFVWLKAKHHSVSRYFAMLDRDTIANGTLELQL